MTYTEKLKIVAEILKKKFTNLTVSETIDLAGQIVDSLENKK